MEAHNVTRFQRITRGNRITNGQHAPGQIANIVESLLDEDPFREEGPYTRLAVDPEFLDRV